MNCFLFVRYLLLFQICICFVTNSILAQENIPNYLDTYSQSVKDVEISKSIMYVNNGKTIETIPEKYSSHSYNERFLLIESVYFNSDKDLFRSYKVDYFNNDKKKSENYTSICKDVIDSYEYKYNIDSNGRYTHTSINDDYTYEYEYSTSNTLIRLKNKRSENIKIYNVNFIDRSIEVENIVDKNQNFKEYYYYDTNWNLVQYLKNADNGENVVELKLYYNSKNYVETEQLVVYGYRTTVKYLYEYDSNENWNKMTAYTLSKENNLLVMTPFYTSYRKITYFNKPNKVVRNADSVVQSLFENNNAINKLFKKPLSVEIDKSLFDTKDTDIVLEKSVKTYILVSDLGYLLNVYVNPDDQKYLSRIVTQLEKYKFIKAISSTYHTKYLVFYNIKLYKDGSIDFSELPDPDSTFNQATNGSSDGIESAKAIKKVQPNYPVDAKHYRIIGTVYVMIIVDEKGNVIKSTSIYGPLLLRCKSSQAASKWKFTPTKVLGKAVKTQGILRFNYTLR